MLLALQLVLFVSDPESSLSEFGSLSESASLLLLLVTVSLLLLLWHLIEGDLIEPDPAVPALLLLLIELLLLLLLLLFVGEGVDTDLRSFSFAAPVAFSPTSLFPTEDFSPVLALLTRPFSLATRFNDPIDLFGSLTLPCPLSVLLVATEDATLMVLALRLTGTFPSMNFAGGGGCNIHFSSSLRMGRELTTGGWYSLTGGLRGAK